MTTDITGIVGRYFAINLHSLPDEVKQIITEAFTLIAALTAEEAIDSKCVIGSPTNLTVFLKYIS
nr:hypothetical protein Iba_chr14aCG5160 [Ipomoea batatas]GME10646.1 hypothetical protein Iba_scaffold10328CG0250 [Ipomoea batatas]